MGNPGWCLDGSNGEAYLHRCGHGGTDYQLWRYTAGATNLKLVHVVDGDCLAGGSDALVSLSSCGDAGTSWDAVGRNGWVMLVNRAYGGCLIPWGTWAPGFDRYDLVLEDCNPADPNVPNPRAWRYFI